MLQCSVPGDNQADDALLSGSRSLPLSTMFTATRSWQRLFAARNAVLARWCNAAVLSVLLGSARARDAISTRIALTQRSIAERAMDRVRSPDVAVPRAQHRQAREFIWVSTQVATMHGHGVYQREQTDEASAGAEHTEQSGKTSARTVQATSRVRKFLQKRRVATVAPWRKRARSKMSLGGDSVAATADLRPRGVPV